MARVFHATMLQELLDQLKACDADHRQLEEKRAALLLQVQTLETRAARVLRRFESGDYVVNSSGRHFWCRDGQILEAVLHDDLQGLEELVKLKAVARETASRAV